MILFSIGACAPTIAAYVSLTKAKVITSKQFFKTVFAVKQPVLMYLLVIGFVVVYYGTGVLTGIAEYTQTPIYSSLLTFPLMLLGAGFEEVGWRFIFQPELEKKLPFSAASSVVGIVWTVWHLPLFLVGFYPFNFGLYLIGTIGMSFAYAAIYRLSKSVWLCVFIHAMNNALGASFSLNISDFSTAVIPVAITSAVLIVVSIIVVFVHSKKLKDTIV